MKPYGMGMRTIGAAATIASLICAASAQAKPFSEMEVPGMLKSWIPWVMHDVEKSTCPFFYTNQNQRMCEWPTSLALDLTSKGGHFSYTIELVDTKDDKPQRVMLPGQSDMWPQDVTVNGKPQPVLPSNGSPSVLLLKGSYTISGTYVWDKLPATVTLPQQVGMVNVKVNGKSVAIPQIEGNQLSLQRDAADTQQVAENHLDVKLFRKLTDSIPQQLETRVALDVSGKQREEVLGTVLGESMEPLSIMSELPARLDAGGKLRVQVRPGQYEVTIISRLKAQANQFTLPEVTGVLPPEEIWAFEARQPLRLVQLSGALAVDPNQTEMPAEWRALPAYLMKPGETLALQEIKRGAGDEAPDQLSLQRKLWLDYSGDGYTAQDSISGTIKRSSRLEVMEGVQLGSASINGQDQYVNTIKADGKPGAAGVEVREGAIQLVSNSRADAAAVTHPSGWNAKFDALYTTLYLPPGWSLLAASGVDNVSRSWISRWTLLDVFLVMIATAGAYRLWGVRVGVIAGATLLLVHPELPPFTVLLLVLMALHTIAQALKPSRLKSAAGIASKLVMVALVISVLPFMFAHLRGAVFPQLESPGAMRRDNGGFGGGMQQSAVLPRMESEMAMNGAVAGSIDDGGAMPVATLAVPSAPPLPTLPTPASMAKEPMEQPVDAAKDAVEERKIAEKPALKKSDYRARAKNKSPSAPAPQNYQSNAPDTKVQTGYSQRNIAESGIALGWNGAVEPTAAMHVWLISARMNLLIALLRVGLIAVLMATLLGSALPHMHEKLRKFVPLFLLVCFISTLPGTDASAKSVIPPAGQEATDTAKSTADFPPSDVLDELKDKLSERFTQPETCLPECATLARTRIDIAGNQLMLDLEIHADAEVAVPLPGGIANFRPASILLNGKPVEAAAVNSDGFLLVKLGKGISKLRLIGAIAPNSNALGLSFPLTSHYSQVAANGWSVQGVRDNGIAERSLQFTRTEMQHSATNAEDGFKKTTLPAFYRVERTITLAKRWEVTTVVHKLNTYEAPSATQIPLLSGESVTSSTTQVKDGKALISFDAGARDVAFQSVLKEGDAIALSAPKDANWVEVWRLNASNLWHVTTSGIPRIAEANASATALWMPWPGERLTFAIERPSGIEGATRTIDESNLTITPGDRSTDATLDLQIRSSLGDQHIITLPENAVLTEVTKNGAVIPSQLKGHVLTLPLTPGNNRFVARWTQPDGIGVFYRPSAVDIGAERSVNANIAINAPQDRWMLVTAGPVMGPAVLFWSWLPVILLLAYGLGKVQASPLRMPHWCVFLLGISLSSISGIIIMIAWVLALAWRSTLNRERVNYWRFNLLQIALGFLTLLALRSLLDSVHTGLLGHPQMLIQGNGSYGTSLRWYQDITAALLPQPLVVSVPIWVYRAVMLLWALWLAFSLVRWLRWGWNSFTSGGYWSKLWRTKPVSNEN